MRPRSNLALVKPRDDENLEQLLGLMARGDESALTKLYDATCGLVNGLALRILKDPGAAEEVTLDVYLQVWRQAARYDADRGRPLAWILTVARSRAIDRFRATGLSSESDLDHAASVVSGDPDPEESVVVAERRRLVMSALARLAPEQRQVVELAYFAGLSHSAIAARLDQPLGTVKTRARLGMTRLREALGGDGLDLL